MPKRIFTALALGTLLSGAALAQDMEHDQTDHANMTHHKMDNHDHGTMDHDAHSAYNTVTEQPASAVEGRIITTNVNGLVCDFCAQALTKVFKKEAAVKDITVDLDAAQVLIMLKDGENLEDSAIKKLINKSGYSLVSIERSGGA